MDRHYSFEVDVNPGIVSTNPGVAPVTLENAILVDVEIIIPPGHAGLTGIQIRQSGTGIIPFATNKFITGNDYSRVFPINTEIGSRAISVAVFNTDVFTHLFWVRFHLADISRAATQATADAAQPLTNAISEGFTNELAPAVTVSGAGDIIQLTPTEPPVPAILSLPAP